MTERTKMIIQLIAAQEGVSTDYIENEMRKAIREAMATTDPHAQAMWKQISLDGKEPDLDAFLEFVSSKAKATGS